MITVEDVSDHATSLTLGQTATLVLLKCGAMASYTCQSQNDIVRIARYAGVACNTQVAIAIRGGTNAAEWWTHFVHVLVLQGPKLCLDIHGRDAFIRP